MLIVLDKNNGEVSEQFSELIGQLADGRYLIQVRELGGKTPRDYQETYFAMLDAVRDYQGDGRYVIHERFKHYRKVHTTTAFTIQEWVDFIEAFKWWVFNTLDLIL